jgi:hypothetical protein
VAAIAESGVDLLAGPVNSTKIESIAALSAIISTAVDDM